MRIPVWFLLPLLVLSLGSGGFGPSGCGSVGERYDGDVAGTWNVVVEDSSELWVGGEVFELASTDAGANVTLEDGTAIAFVCGPEQAPCAIDVLGLRGATTLDLTQPGATRVELRAHRPTNSGSREERVDAVMYLDSEASTANASLEAWSDRETRGCRTTASIALTFVGTEGGRPNALEGEIVVSYDCYLGERAPNLQINEAQLTTRFTATR